MSYTDLTPDFVITPASGAQEGDGAVPRFFLEPRQNGFKSAEAGRPVFDEVEMVEIHVPGDRKTVPVRLVNDEIRQRFPRAYAAFKQGLEAPTEGTALTEWPGITRSVVEELRFAHVKTVEQLAALPDDALNRTVSMGGFALREKARRYLEQANGQAPADKLAAELEARDATIAQMREQLEAMQAQIARLSTAAEAPTLPGAPKESKK